MLKNWQIALQTDKTNKTIGCLIQAFHAALLRVSNEEDEVSEYKVDGKFVFNSSTLEIVNVKTFCRILCV